MTRQQKLFEASAIAKQAAREVERAAKLIRPQSKSVADALIEKADGVFAQANQLTELTHNTAGHDGKYRGKLSSVPRGTFALDGRSKLFDGLYRVVRGDFTVAYFESESDAVAYVAAGNRGEL